MNASRKWVDLFQVTSNQFFSLIDLKPNFFIIAYLRLACKKITVVFGLAEKHRKRTFSAEKNRILRNLSLRLSVFQKALTICLDGKSGKNCTSRRLLNLASHAQKMRLGAVSVQGLYLWLAENLWRLRPNGLI